MFSLPDNFIASTTQFMALTITSLSPLTSLLIGVGIALLVLGAVVAMFKHN